uniref:Secreted protein n=2 Tax=Oryza TaxID=4527 RepID=A0A0E0PYH6_ORYRU
MAMMLCTAHAMCSVLLRGSSWEVSPGRRNSMTASNTAVNSNIVAAFGKKGDGLPYYSVAATRLLGGAIGSDDDL